MNISQLVFGAAAGPLIGWAAWRAGTLSRSGAAAAAVVGAAVFGAGGFLWAAGLLLFFVSSSLLSRMFASKKRAAEEKYAKGSRRDGLQVAANGGLGAVMAVAHLAFPDAAWPWIAFLGALAAVNADTWATELGVLRSRAPRLITTGRPVEPGTSGGVTAAGLAASGAGAALIGVLVLFSFPVTPALWPAVALGGFVGSLFDSLLGATVQAIYFCPVHGKETEQHPFHQCGAPTNLLRGLRWMNNDLVNLAASAAGAGTAVLAAQLLLQNGP